MKNYMEQFRVSLVSGATDYTSTKVLTAETDLKVHKSRLYDTSSSANAFAALSAGSVIRMYGWGNYKNENDGVFTVTEKGHDGDWIAVDRPLIDVAEADIPDGGITMERSPATWTVTGVRKASSKVMGALDLTNPSVAGPDSFVVTGNNAVASFMNLAGDTNGDDVVVCWADLSAG
jgi:hypothetical protein